MDPGGLWPWVPFDEEFSRGKSEDSLFMNCRELVAVPPLSTWSLKLNHRNYEPGEVAVMAVPLVVLGGETHAPLAPE